MRIAMFTNTYAPIVGGIEKSVATFAADLGEVGHEVVVVTLRQGDDPEEDGVLRLPALPAAVGGRYAWKLPGDGGLAEALDAFSPEVVHAHQPFLLGDSAYRQAAKRGLPLVFTNHTLYERYADRAFLAEFAALERAARTLAVVYANRCDKVVAPTESVAAILAEQGVEPGIEIVPTGIDVAAFSRGDGRRFRERHGIPAGAFVAGHLGRLIPAKRVVYLAEAVASFLAGTPDAYALFCGEGESVGEIRECFVAAGVADRLVLLGNLPEGEVADAYAAMDLFAFASLTDTQGIVLLEAMAAGLPILALRATGPQDLVPDGRCGRLLDPAATPAQFADGLAEFAGLAGSADLAGMGAAAREHAAEFDRRLCAGLLAGVYEKALRNRRNRGEALPADSLLGELQQGVETEWRLLADRAPVVRALLPTRGFPGESPRRGGGAG